MSLFVMAYHLKNNSEKWMINRRVLGIDHGTKTLGLALANSEQTLVTPLETIQRKKWSVDKIALAKIIAAYDIEIIIIGYPLNMDGTKGARCQSVRDFVTMMEVEWSNIPVFYWDERLSTNAVHSMLDDTVDMWRTNRKQIKDALAAQIILQEALGFVQRA